MPKSILILTKSWKTSKNKQIMNQRGRRRSVRKRKRKEEEDIPKKRTLRRKAKRVETFGVCEIGGSKGCTGEKSKLVELNGCSCKKLCLECAKEWFKNSSTCPFCRSEVSLVNGCLDVSFQKQREDHDTMKHVFSFVYRDMFGDHEVFNAFVPQSVLFANKRAQWKVSDVILFLLRILDDDDHSIHNIVESNAYYHFSLMKLCSLKGRNQKILLRILFYYALLKQSSSGFFFLMTMLRHKLATRKSFGDVTWSKEMRISKAIFKDIPKPLFDETSSCLDMMRKSKGTRNCYLLLEPLKVLYPNEDWSEFYDDPLSDFVPSDVEEEEEEISFPTTTYTFTTSFI